MRWRFLEHGPGACSVVTRRMELIYLNAAARTLVPQKWFGCRCWEAFPVADQACAVRCPVIRAVRAAREISYCEETVYPGGKALALGVAVIPLPAVDGIEGQALIFLRPKPPGMAPGAVQDAILEDARALQVRALNELHLAA